MNWFLSRHILIIIIFVCKYKRTQKVKLMMHRHAIIKMDEESEKKCERGKTKKKTRDSGHM